MSLRPARRLIKSKLMLEGASMHLRMACGFDNTTEFDPFLLLDDFGNDVPEDYLGGFSLASYAGNRDPSPICLLVPWNTTTE